jgi:hypothetical protein
MQETFKGITRRFLIPFEDDPRIPKRGENSTGGEPDYGFDDTEVETEGLSGGINKGLGGRAQGKAKLTLPKDFAKRKQVLEESIDKEVTSLQLCEGLSVTKDCVKEIVKDAFLRSKELSRIQKENEYSILPLVDQKPHESEQEVEPGTKVEYLRLENSVRKEIAVIKRRLFDLVTDRKYPRWVPGADKGKRIDRRLIARVPLGQRNFFKYKIESDVLDIAFELLVDESGSMGGSKAAEARRCAVMFGKLLSSLNIPFEIIGFTTAPLTEEQADKLRRQSNESKSYNRAENLCHYMYKRFTDRYDQVKTKLVHINAHSNNFDQDDIEWAWQRLLKYCLANRVTRKVMIVISDGQPVGGEEARTKLKRVISEIGCDPNADIIGIGIQTNYVKDFYHKCIEVKDACELGINVVRLIESAIMKKKGKKIRAEVKK